MRTRNILIGSIAVLGLVVLVILLIPKLHKPAQDMAPTHAPAQDWLTSTPEEQGFDSTKLAEGLRAIQEKHIKIDSLLVIRNGAVILDAYFYPYDGSIPHDLASVTKSIMTTLIGMAVDQGKIQLDQPIVSFFPNRTIANLDARKESVTVRHLAGMVSGFESGCMAADQANLDMMRATPDWVQAALDRRIILEPGVSYCYDSLGMHLLSAILQEATGMTALDFARQYLFEPLAIRDAVWESDPQGYTHGWGDLHLKPLDAAKIGYLWLNNGVWDGKQIVSPTWVHDSITAHMVTGEDPYGYGWWVANDSYYAFGRGGQNIKVVPSLNVVIVTTAASLEYDQIVPLLEAAVVDTEQALPPNPEGVAMLIEVLNEVMQPQSPQVSIPMPEITQSVTGKVYVFEPNPAEVETLSIEFISNSETILHLKLEGDETPIEGLIGLDGKYRLASNGWGLRGAWTDPQTFNLEIFDIGQKKCQLSYFTDRMLLDVSGMTIEGRVENP